MLIIIAIVLNVLQSMLHLGTILSGLFALALLLPSLGLNVRRLHESYQALARGDFAPVAAMLGDDVVLEMLGIDRADYVRVQIRMREREAQDELHGGHAFEQIIEVHVPPPLPLRSGHLLLNCAPPWTPSSTSSASSA